MKFRFFKRKSTADTGSTAVNFPVFFETLHETHSLTDFQREGHFVPAIRERDAQGNLSSKPREWQGSTVHAISLLGEDGKPHQTPNAKGEMRSTVRVLSDSREDAERLFSDQMRNSFYAQLRAQAIADFSADQARKVKDERDRLVTWMVHHAPPNELAKVLGIAESAIEDYKRSQIDPAMKADVEAKLGRPL